MISRSGSGNFLKDHYDWIAAGVGIVALAGAAAFCLLGSDVEEEIRDVTSRVERRGEAKADVGELDLKPYFAVTNSSRVESVAETVRERAVSFFGSEKRILCRDAACGRATPEKFDEQKNLVCAFCGATQVVVKVVKDVDTDGDGIPDEKEKKLGLNPNDPADAEADADGDDFTNLEEFKAGTDPNDKNDHPNYLDSLRIKLPLKETYMPFVFTGARKVADGWRCEFFDASQKDDYGRAGRTLTALIGEEIGVSAKKPSGFTLKEYVKKEAKRDRKGMKGMKVSVDVSEATVVRKTDGKEIVLVLAESKRAKPAPVDVQATLVYTRRSVKQFDVVAGTEINLSGEKYKVVSIKGSAKEARVLLEKVDAKSGEKKQYTIEALEP